MVNENVTLGKEINQLKSSHAWEALQTIKRNLTDDLTKHLFMEANTNVALESEVQLGQIMAYRKGVIDGVDKFFGLLEMLNGRYKDHLKQQEVESKTEAGL